MRTPFRKEMNDVSVARRYPGFSLNRYLAKYLLNERDLAVKGYERVPISLKTEKNFYGFVKHNDIWLRKLDEYKICVRTTIPPSMRPQFGEYLAEEEYYVANLYMLRSNFTSGGAAFNPDHALLSVSAFPKIYTGKISSTGIPLYSSPVYDWGNIKYTQPTYINGEKTMQTVSAQTGAKVCFPVIIVAGLEFIKDEVTKKRETDQQA